MALDNSSLASCIKDEQDHFHHDLPIREIMNFFHSKFKNPEGIKAVILYGSGLWSGASADRIWDFHILVDKIQDNTQKLWPRIAGCILPPNVFYYEIPLQNKNFLRCKCNVMRHDQFSSHAKGYCLTPHIWARFSQPCQILHISDKKTGDKVINDLASCTKQFIKKGLLFIPNRYASSQEIWITALRNTYSRELRSEGPERAKEIYKANQELFDKRLKALFKDKNTYLVYDKGQYKINLKRRFVKKTFSVLGRPFQKVGAFIRLLKSATTFENATDYALEKTRRHSGIYIAPTEFQRKHPLIGGWSLLWRLWRKGAFR